MDGGIGYCGTATPIKGRLQFYFHLFPKFWWGEWGAGGGGMGGREGGRGGGMGAGGGEGGGGLVTGQGKCTLHSIDRGRQFILNLLRLKSGIRGQQHLKFHKTY